MTEEQPGIQYDYTITAFLCEETWQVKYEVHPGPESDSFYQRAIFDTLDEAKICVSNLRFYPRTYVSNKYGEWSLLKNV